ncbi:MAG: hypothetical protein NVS3B26_11630 [Mycobacteriales bacterium]
MADSFLGAQRWLIATAVVLTGCVFLPSLADPVNVVKLTLLALAAITAGVLALTEIIRRRIVDIPRGPAVWTAVAFSLALTATAFAAPHLPTALVGTYGRNSGWIAYLSALVLFGVGVRVWTTASAHILALAVVASGAFTASYGLLQYAGVDAIHWNNPYNPIIASLGNPDFASAYLGICAPAALWGAVWKRWALPWRAVSALVCAMCLVAAVLSKAVQGPLAAGAGLAVVAAALLLERGGPAGRRGLLALGGLTAVGAAILLAGAAKVGPAAPIFRRSSFQARQYYWNGALAMFHRRPLFGVGLDHYGIYWRQVRSDAATRALGGSSYSDAAHSVPLQMLAQGGLVLGVTYLAFLLTVAICLFRGLRRLDGPGRILLGAIGGTWTAYVVSAAVSIDQVPLLTLQFVTAGAIVGLAGVSWREVRLPGVPQPAPDVPGRKRRQAPVIRQRAVTSADLGMIASTVVIGLVAAWFALLPFRASAAARAGDVALARGDGTGALAAFQHATASEPGEGAYWQRLGSLYETANQPAKAYQAYAAGLRHAPYDLSLLLNAGRLAQSQKDSTVAARDYAAALRLDPTGPVTVKLVAAYDAGTGRPADAVAALLRATRANPRDAELWSSLGTARRVFGDRAGARVAFERALQLTPGLPSATQGLKALPTPPRRPVKSSG